MQFLQPGIEYYFLLVGCEKLCTFVGYEKVGDVTFMKVKDRGFINLINPNQLELIASAKDTNILMEIDAD